VGLFFLFYEEIESSVRLGEAEDGDRHFVSFRAGKKNAQYLLREKSDFQTMEEEQKVLISMPSENNNRRSSVLPFDADSSHFVL
jgi:hypothetical protein